MIGGNSLQADYTYHPHGPIDSITVQGVPILHRLSYTPDALLDVEGIVEELPGVSPDPSYVYSYDGAFRLSQASLPASLGLPAPQDYAYDDAGNREDARIRVRRQESTHREPRLSDLLLRRGRQHRSAGHGDLPSGDRGDARLRQDEPVRG